ncbi:hypothetical protein [Streptomyces sp. NPDC004629]|uniref:hypothetical protein n=1 Tax=Streptomyces sp. NPDC004629 TaxID=3364705 RepID=UPI00367CD00E
MAEGIVVNEEHAARVGQVHLQRVLIGAIKPGSLCSGIGSAFFGPDVPLSGDR